MIDNKVMAENGYMIYEDTDGGYVLQKEPTSKNPQITISSKHCRGRLLCSTYQEAMNHAMEALGLVPEKVYFASEARYDRGLGWETKMMDGVMSSKISEAKRLAWEQAEEFFRNSEDFKNCRLGDVRIRPNRLD